MRHPGAWRLTSIPFVIALVVALLAAGLGAAQPVNGKNYLEEANRLTMDKKFDKAELLYKSALDSCEQAGVSDRIDCRIQVLDAEFGFYEASGNISGAQDTLNLLTILQKDHPAYQSPYYVSRLAIQNAQLAQMQKDWPKAERLYRFARDTETSDRGNNTLFLTYAEDGLALTAEKQGRTTEAKEHRDRAQAIREQLSACKALPEKRFQPFIDELQKTIRAHWYPPPSSKELRVVLDFRVNAGGKISDIKVKQSSGRPEHDEEAIKALQRAAPFKNVPQLCVDFVPVQFIFDYELYKTARKH